MKAKVKHLELHLDCKLTCKFYVTVRRVQLNVKLKESVWNNTHVEGQCGEYMKLLLNKF